jgi:hypothetical protein
MLNRITRREVVRGAIVAVAIVLASLLATAPALAEGPDHRPIQPGGEDHVAGVVFARGQANRLGTQGSNLVYHNGPVMHTNTTYAIYWIPAGYTVSANYVSLLNGFLQNVAGADGSTSNVYYSSTQYSDNVNGKILYGSTFGGAWTDTSALPASGCTDAYTSVCLSDAQLQSEVEKAMAANGWSAGPTHLFFLFTAKGIGSCSGSSCAFSQYCAYHGWVGSGSSVILYANMPYADTVSAACDAGQRPNNDDADATINVSSHEHNEAITDEQGNAWYDRRGYENGDKCAWNFGSPLGGSNGAHYNQVINGAHYYLQQEWSNKSSRCVLKGQ